MSVKRLTVKNRMRVRPPTAKQQAVLDAIDKRNGQRITAKYLAGDLGISVHAAHVRLRDMCESGLLEMVE